MEKKVLVLASGRGSDFQAITDHINLGILNNVKIECLVCNHAGAMVLERAARLGIETFCFPGVTGTKFETKEERETARSSFDQRWRELAKKSGIDLVVLAGFDQILSSAALENSPPLLINIHPAYDLQRFGGKNMVGRKVHEAVLNSGADYSGCTVHVVTNIVDMGAPILKKKVKITPGESVESLEQKVLAMEHLAYPEVIQLLADDRVIIKDEGSKCFVDRLSNNWDSEWKRRQARYLETQAEEKIGFRE